ncbi:TPA: hypothetical protein HA249_02090 [Candidatus Woesearchaeota archaeon]|nr:hypothetical protein [Candidatus Woesearchaeota archaeon]HII88312.1 hypothetical protein [Candidatus Woesearchaeota archaeon]
MNNAFADTYTTNPEMGLPELANRLGVDLNDLTDQTTAPEGQGPETLGSRVLRIINTAPVFAGLATGFAVALAVHNTQAGPALAIPPIVDASSISPTSPYGFGSRMMGYAAGVALNYAPQLADTAYQLIAALGPQNGM